MEIEVWIQSIVQGVNFLFNRLNALSSPKNQSNGGVLPNALASVVPTISTSMNAINPVQTAVLRIQRNPTLATKDALFGAMAFDDKYIGVTMERIAVMIPEGTYRGYKRDSAHFGMRVVGIDVPNRTDIECHPANAPNQLLGCIAVGTTKDGDALDSSRAAFDLMMETVPETFVVVINSLRV